MLRISKLADYGTLILAAMAHAPERMLSAAEIASRTRLPAATTSKILKKLSSGGLAVSLRGAKGGYMLARAPAHIAVAQIIEVMDGPIGITECSAMPGLCMQEPKCPARSSWQKVNLAVLQALQQVTLAQMIQPAANAPADPGVPLARQPALEIAAFNSAQGEA